MVSESKSGRNDPCPCGSGKKYKQCCLGKVEERRRRGGAGWSLGILLVGMVGAVLLWQGKGLGAGLAALAAGIIAAGAVYVLRDPAPPRKGGSDPSAINFGGKS